MVRAFGKTTKESVETLKANAIKHQGHVIRALLQRYVNDPRGLETLKKYKKQFMNAKLQYLMGTMLITEFEAILQ